MQQAIAYGTNKNLSSGSELASRVRTATFPPFFSFQNEVRTRPFDQRQGRVASRDHRRRFDWQGGHFCIWAGKDGGGEVQSMTATTGRLTLAAPLSTTQPEKDLAWLLLQISFPQIQIPVTEMKVLLLCPEFSVHVISTVFIHLSHHVCCDELVDRYSRQQHKTHVRTSVLRCRHFSCRRNLDSL